jgi:hypothetical protein
MARAIEVPLSEREEAYLQEQVQASGMSEGRVLLQALRMFQVWRHHPELWTRLEELHVAEFGIGGCAGDD